jgi:hypothetical protein
VSRDERHRSRSARYPDNHNRTSGTFTCGHCRAIVPTLASGTRHRNHCPQCLWSRHLDETPGDRAADCGSLMEPLCIAVRGDGEWLLVHRCSGCDELHLNRTSADDNPLLLVRIAVRAIAQPPFPLDRLTDL